MEMLTITTNQRMRLRMLEVFSWKTALASAREIVEHLPRNLITFTTLLRDDRTPLSLQVALIEEIQKLYLKNKEAQLSPEDLILLGQRIAAMPPSVLRELGGSIRDIDFFYKIADVLLQQGDDAQIALVRLVAASPISRDEYQLMRLYYKLNEQAQEIAAWVWPPLPATRSKREALLQEMPPVERASRWTIWKDIESAEVLEDLPPLLRGLAIMGRLPKDEDKAVTWLASLPDQDLVWLLQRSANPLPPQLFKKLIETLVQKQRIRTAQQCMLTQPAYLKVDLELCKDNSNFAAVEGVLRVAEHLDQEHIHEVAQELSYIVDRRLCKQAIQFCCRVTPHLEPELARYIIDHAETLPKHFVHNFLDLHRQRSPVKEALAFAYKDRAASLYQRVKDALQAIKDATEISRYDGIGEKVRKGLFEKSVQNKDIRFLGQRVFTPDQEYRLLSMLPTAKVLLLGITREIHPKALGQWLAKQQSPVVHFLAALLWPPSFYQVRTQATNVAALAGWGIMLNFPIPLFIMATKFVIKEIRAIAALPQKVRDMQRNYQVRSFDKLVAKLQKEATTNSKQAYSKSEKETATSSRQAYSM
ncbi:MAG: hypothetical protein QXS54_00765 [Candidatus Methanomethylicaceae archaeon]